MRGLFFPIRCATRLAKVRAEVSRDGRSAGFWRTAASENPMPFWCFNRQTDQAISRSARC
jgi:hypothetical protein